MAVNFPGSSSGGGGGAPTSYLGSPVGTDWIVGFNEYTSTEQMISAGSYPMGPFWFDTIISGAGTSIHSNNAKAAGSYGIREEKINNTASALLSHRTDIESGLFSDGTFRVGCRMQIPTFPVSGGNNFYWYIGMSEGVSGKNTDHALIGIETTKNAGNFVVLTRDGTTENVTDTGVTVVVDTWYNLEIECTPTTVSAWVDGVNVLDASTTNHPRTTAKCVVFHQMMVTIGTPSGFQYAYRDWNYFAFKPAAARGALGTGGPWG